MKCKLLIKKICNAYNYSVCRKCEWNKKNNERLNNILFRKEEQKMNDIYIEVTGWHIHYTGDESVGDFDANWEINGNMYFEDKEELEDFRKKIEDLFESQVCTFVKVYTFEELEEQIKLSPNTNKTEFEIYYKGGIKR